MKTAVYHKLREALDTLPNGFPATEEGVEIKILQKIFAPEEAELFCDLKLGFETVEQIAGRTKRPLTGLKELLDVMSDKGQIWKIDLFGASQYKMLPWVFGIFEFQLERMDRELAELNEQFMPHFGTQFFSQAPAFMQTLPIEEEIPSEQEALPFERITTIIENSRSFAIRECICKKEKAALDEPCDRPTAVCMAFAPIPNFFDTSTVNHAITKEEALALLKEAENNALVHLTSNVQHGHFFICNCCGCCCGVLRGINELGIPAAQVINSSYIAVIDPEKCINCGICEKNRCQVKAIRKTETTYEVITENCIGCGLCITTCPKQAITLLKKDESERQLPPVDETSWFKERGAARGVDFSKFV